MNKMIPETAELFVHVQTIRVRTWICLLPFLDNIGTWLLFEWLSS